MTATTQQQITDYETCLPEAETLIDCLEILLFDMPHQQTIQQKINLAIDEMREVYRLAEQEKNRLTALS